jgi:hypothetical protein
VPTSCHLVPGAFGPTPCLKVQKSFIRKAMLRAKQPRILQFGWFSPSCRIAFEFLVDRSSTHPTKHSSSMPTRLCAADVSKHTIAEALVRVVEQFTASWKYAPAGSRATMLFREAPCSHNTFFLQPSDEASTRGACARVSAEATPASLPHSGIYPSGSCFRDLDGTPRALTRILHERKCNISCHDALDKA